MTGKLYEKKGKYYVVLNIKGLDGKWRKKWISIGLDFNKNNHRKANSFLQKTLCEYGKAIFSVFSEQQCIAKTKSI